MWVDNGYIADSTFTNNDAGLTSGALFVTGVTVLERVEIVSNIAMFGGEFEVLFDSGVATLIDCTVQNNVATFFANYAGCVH
jgi:hypothetical protein